MCQVTSEHQFSSAIREEIKFAVSMRNGEGKQRVLTRQDLCSLSNDSRQFSFGFDTEQSGVYKVLNPGDLIYCLNIKIRKLLSAR